MVTMGVIRESPMPASASAPIAADPAVSIVVLNYNYGRFVAAAIESALAQTAPGCEVIVVDNGSTDDSAEVIARYADRVRVVRQPVNIGQGQGYNLGIAAARGQWTDGRDTDGASHLAFEERFGRNAILSSIATTLNQFNYNFDANHLPGDAVSTGRRLQSAMNPSGQFLGL